MKKEIAPALPPKSVEKSKRLYGTIHLIKGRANSKAKYYFVINTEPHVSMRLKDWFRKIEKEITGALKLSVTPDTAKDLEIFLLRYPMLVGEQAQKAIDTFVNQYEKRQIDLEEIFLPGMKPRDFALAKPLRDYQAKAVELYLRGNRILCADDLGLGKTVIAIGSFTEKATLPCLVVCQTHLPSQWVEKIAEFLPDLKTHIVRSRRPYSLPEAEVYVMSYSKLQGWDDLFQKGFFKSVIFDEVQELRIPTSQKYIAGKILSQKADYCLGLSATPIYNYGNEIWSVLDLIKEGTLGTYEEFRREWCASGFASGGDMRDKVKDPAGLGSFLRENYAVIRRSRAEVGRELPPINKILHTVEYDENAAKKAESKIEELAAKVISGSFTEKGLAARELNTLARMMTGIAKAKSVADYVRILLENGEKVLLLGWHREVYNIWLNALSEFNPVLYTGSESPTEKAASIESFTNGKSQLLIMSLRSGVGIDGLQHHANVCVFGELDWSPAVHSQIIGRIDRDGQQNQVTAIFLQADGGTDPLMVDTLGLKASQSHGIVNPMDSGEIRDFSDDSKIKRYAEMVLEKRGKKHKNNESKNSDKNLDDV